MSSPQQLKKRLAAFMLNCVQHGEMTPGAARMLSKLVDEELTDPDTKRGLYGKYRVEKANGKPIGECFVLEQHDRHAVAALRAYAESCLGDYQSLATDLALMADRWESA